MVCVRCLRAGFEDGDDALAACGADGDQAAGDLAGLVGLGAQHLRQRGGDAAAGGAAGDPGGWWAAPLALAVTVILHLWRRNAAVSILVGTALYVVLVNVVA